MPAEDTTVVAQWIENATSEVVKIMFSKKEMTKDEITEIIKRYTKENFTIEEIGVNENDSLVVIIRFNDAMSAKNFVDAIARNNDNSNLFIERISFFSKPPQSMATVSKSLLSLVFFFFFPSCLTLLF